MSNASDFRIFQQVRQRQLKGLMPFSGNFPASLGCQASRALGDVTQKCYISYN